jgi:peptidoglycan/LPS O-acetylase OafA/YrhL
MTNSRERVASLDLIRGMAAFTVAITHFLIYQHQSPLLSESVSILAVEVFFVLSGFVLAPQMIACARDQRRNTYVIFLVRRWMRTVPAYLAALVAITLLTGTFHWADAARYALYIQNLFHQSNTVDYFPVAWSLSVEEWFYVTFPLSLFAVVAAVGRGDERAMVAAALIYILAVTLLRSSAGDFENWGAEVRRVVVFRVDSIAYGFLLFLAIDWLARSKLSDRFSGATLAISALAALVCSCVVALRLTLDIGEHADLLGEHLFPLAACSVGATGIFLAWLLRETVDRFRALRETAYFLGRISYSVYLFHMMVLMVLHDLLISASMPLGLAIYILTLIAFCAVFFSSFEKPILSARPRFRPALRHSFELPR